ncbi:hypothetical protein IAD21_00659 [Abditibacteriota bacterium]|nr:hypothetical protein IAD21_00659 [Abditibacteriota bacterium]
MYALLIQKVVLCFGLFAFASLLGALSYAAIMLTKGAVQSLIFGVCLLTMIIAICASIPTGLPIVGGIGLLCLLPASLEWRLDGNKDEWTVHFVRLITATFTSAIIGSVLVVLYVIITHSRDDLPEVALGAGFLLTPPSISLLRWMLHTSKLRPGIDRPLDQDEKLS